jgi:Cof subfamily protein (haloacid dehalogenase superfamily)
MEATNGKIRMVVIDLDGTALTGKKELTPKTISAISRCIKRGIHVIFASARPPRSVKPYYDQCGLDTPQINYNGALVYDPVALAALMHLPLDQELVGQVVQHARSLYSRTLVSLEIMDRWYTDEVDPHYATEVAKTFSPDAIGPIESFLVEPITKLMLLGPPVHLFMVRKEIQHAFRGEVNIVSTEDYMLQLMRRDASKSAAVRMLARRFNVAREEVLAIGDALNDVGMISWAGIGVAMANAAPEVKKVADYVTRSNEEDGLGLALEIFAM